MTSMRKLFVFALFLFAFLFVNQPDACAQETEDQGVAAPKSAKRKKENRKGQSQEDLDADNAATNEKQKSPEQLAYEKKMAKAHKEKEKKNAITRKQADKKAAKRLNKSKSKTKSKKKKYVKTHGG
ncbi:MAG: tolA [Chitinophagaceae bacterium]|nr:tolA [Chitinophagaceae bacterium]